LASVRQTGRGFVWLWLAISLTGCAAHQSASPFIIRSGHGSLEAGRTVSSKIDRRKIEDASRKALAERAASRALVPLSIEGVDPPLRDALAALGRQESPDSHIAVAMNYWRLRVYDAAFDHYSAAIRLDPKNATALDGRARVWRHWGMTEPALLDIHRALYYSQGRPDLMNTLGTILEAAGQCSEAHEAYEGAVKLDPSATWAKSNLDRLQCAPPIPGS
jgi:tetratricopeptide (TPR) repeat protein